MSELLPPEIHYLNAAEGWFELGNCHEALRELDRLAEGEQGRLEVLALRWSILAGCGEWLKCFEVAERMVSVSPKQVLGWIHRSYALHELGRTEEARESLLPAASQFPKDQTIPYNLACYECRLGNLEIAMDWLKRALKLPSPARLKAQALKDLDLQPLWKKISQLTASPRRRAGD